MAVSLQETISKTSSGLLATNPDGSGGLLSWQDIGTYIRERYIKNNEEKARQEKSARRQRFYQGQGDAEMFEMLQAVYKSAEVIELRRQFVEFAKYFNMSRRITNEVATVYNVPATRLVDGDENNEHYQEVQRVCRQHEVMQRVNRLGFLHRALAVGPRMRMAPSGKWEPTIDVVTPAKFWAVRDPLDPTLLVALIFENDYALASPMKRGATWTVVGWHETMSIDEDGLIVEASIRPHGYSRLPWVLLTLEPPDGCLLDSTTGDDITAAHEMSWFLHVLHGKESKSYTVQTIAQGDVTNAARRQVNDTDATGVVGEGVQIIRVDRSLDVSVFTDGAKHVAETCGSNYGIAPQVMRGESEQSADARELARLPLRELRLQQQVPLREFEREFAEVQSMVIAKGDHRPDLAFNTVGWRINFSDPQTPLGTKEALEVFEQKRRMGLQSTRGHLMSEDPDLSPEGADQVIEKIVDDELKRNKLMRPLQAISGSPGAGMPDGTENNGGGRPPIADDENTQPMRATA